MTKQTPISQQAILMLATGMGVGYSPLLPGSFGSLWGVLLCWLAFYFELPIVNYLICMLLLLLAGVPICGRAARIMNIKDPGSIVWDELAAMPVVFLPLIYLTNSLIALPGIMLGFLLFRLFDITKPWPIRRLEKLPGGWGIMTDDLVAAIYAAGALLMFNSIWPL